MIWNASGKMEKLWNCRKMIENYDVRNKCSLDALLHWIRQTDPGSRLWNRFFQSMVCAGWNRIERWHFDISERMGAAAGDHNERAHGDFKSARFVFCDHRILYHT